VIGMTSRLFAVCAVLAAVFTPVGYAQHSIATPVASTARTVAAATSGPMPSPGINVIW